MKSILDNIRSKMDSLKKAESQVAKCILNDPYIIIESTITDVAKKSKVSEPTVVRFCCKIGLKGYMDLRINLARELPAPVYSYETVNPGDSEAQILGKTFTCHNEEIRKTLYNIDISNFTTAVDMLNSAKRIDLFGFGGSGLIADEAWHKFFQLGIPCNTYKDAHLHLIGASLLDQDSAVIAISISGSALDLIESVKEAKKTGAKIISITGKKQTPIDKYCDISFHLECQEPIPWLFHLSTRLTQMALLDALFISLALKKSDEGKVNFNKIKNSISVKNY